MENEFSSGIVETLSGVLVSIIFLLNGIGIISQATAARELVEHGVPAGLVPFLMLCGRTIARPLGSRPLCLTFSSSPSLEPVIVGSGSRVSSTDPCDVA